MFNKKMSAKELLDALRSARGEDTISSVLSSPNPIWKNMNQSPPRSFMRDQVDTRETVGVGKWLAYHQQQLNDSEKRRLGNRIRAQEVFEQSHMELSALKEELERSVQYRPPQVPASEDKTSESVRRRVSTMSSMPPGEEINHSDFELPQAPSPEAPIGHVRDLNILRTALADRDSTIERLQNRIVADRAFYQEQLAKVSEESNRLSSDASAKITGLRTQLEIALQHRTPAAALTDSKQHPVPELIESKIEELHVMFHNTLEGLKNKTSSELEVHHAHSASRIDHLAKTTELAIESAKENFRSERMESLSHVQDQLLLHLAREQGSSMELVGMQVQTSLDRLARTLEARLTTDITSAVQRELRATPMTTFKQFLSEEVRGNVMQSIGEELARAVAERVAVLTAIFENEMKAARQSLFHVAASFAGIDAKRVDGILTSTQNEFKELRHEAQKAANIQRMEHLEFMSKTKLVLEKMKQSKSTFDRYL